jgi:23S rRNA (guanosine2251-2'-O)-methyltransferase
LHSVTARVRTRPETIRDVYVDAARDDPRIRELKQLLTAQGLRVMAVDGQRLDGMTGGARHQGVVAAVTVVQLPAFVDEVLEAVEARGATPLLLILDGIQDPHNLGACLRVADAAGVHAVLAPKDRSVGLTATAIKVASGAADSVPYITVTNLARTLRELKDKGIWLIGTGDEAGASLFAERLAGALAWIVGAEGEGMRRLTRDLCDRVVSIPMQGSVESLNVSVATGICLYETIRQRETTQQPAAGVLPPAQSLPASA